MGMPVLANTTRCEANVYVATISMKTIEVLHYVASISE